MRKLFNSVNWSFLCGWVMALSVTLAVWYAAIHAALKIIKDLRQ